MWDKKIKFSMLSIRLDEVLRSIMDMINNSFNNRYYLVVTTGTRILDENQYEYENRIFLVLFVFCILWYRSKQNKIHPEFQCLWL